MSSNRILFNTKEISEILGTTLVTIYNYISTGKLRAHKLGGNGKSKRHWRVQQSDLDAFISGETNTSVPAAPLLKKTDEEHTSNISPATGIAGGGSATVHSVPTVKTKESSK